MHGALIASFAAAAVAAPLVSRQAQTTAPEGGDVTIAQYALTLEHLEATFYREALVQFSEEDFKSVGLGADFYNNLQQIAADEAEHVRFLSEFLTSLDQEPVAECEYNFMYTDVQGFLATANVLEGVGVSAYSGAAGVVDSSTVLTVAASILAVEARHSSYLRNSQNPPQSPFPRPYDTPLNLPQVFTLAAPFFVSCPAPSSLELGLSAFPFLTVAPAGLASPGDELTLSTPEAVSDLPEAYFITFPGAPIQVDVATADNQNFVITVPEGIDGQAYVILTSGGAPTDDNVVAGPAVLQVADNAARFQAANPDFVYGATNCDKKDGGKPYPPKPEQPGQYPPKKPEAPKDYPKHPETPKSPETPKQPEAPKYPAHPEQPKKPTEPAKPYPEHPKKDEHKPAEPAKPYPAEPAHPEQKPEDCPEEEKPKTY